MSESSFKETIKQTRQKELDNLEMVDFQPLPFDTIRQFLINKLVHEKRSPNNLTRHLLVKHPNEYLNILNAVSEEVLTTDKFMERVYRIVESDKLPLNEKVVCENCSEELKYYSYRCGYGYKKHTSKLCKRCNKKGSRIRFIRKHGEIEGNKRYEEWRKKQKGSLSLQWFKDKHGDELGEAKYNEYWQFNFSQRSQLPYSKISQELFWSIYEKLDEQQRNKTMFAELKREKRLNLNKEDKIIFGDDKRVCMFIDFCVSNQIVIEFDGDFWHEKTKEQDRKKTLIMENKGYKVLRVKECDFKENRELTVNRCLDFIRDNYEY